MNHVCDWLTSVFYLDCKKKVPSLYPISDEKDTIINTYSAEGQVADEAKVEEHAADETGAKDDGIKGEFPTDISKYMKTFSSLQLEWPTNAFNMSLLIVWLGNWVSCLLSGHVDLLVGQLRELSLDGMNSQGFKTSNA
ncbi:unnamed protein product [Prunus armeniaca]